MGSERYNQGLSERRADSIRRQLIREGVDPRIRTRGYGESQPLESNQTESGCEQNRRVEVTVTGVQ